jgi:hypothetical protein
LHKSVVDLVEPTFLTSLALERCYSTLLVMLATVFVAFERIGLAAVVGGVGVWLLVRCT